jgi:hypothetical protein
MAPVSMMKIFFGPECVLQSDAMQSFIDSLLKAIQIYNNGTNEELPFLHISLCPWPVPFGRYRSETYFKQSILQVPLSFNKVHPKQCYGNIAEKFWDTVLRPYFEKYFEGKTEPGKQLHITIHMDLRYVEHVNEHVNDKDKDFALCLSFLYKNLFRSRVPYKYY